MFSTLSISQINDFIFCPYSIYLHSLYEGFSTDVYHGRYQTRGSVHHQAIDSGQYSSKKRYLQGMSLYSGKYHLAGKLDIYDQEKHYLIERKYHIKKIYDGYRYQLYAQYFCLTERGMEVAKMFLHSLQDNKRYEVPLPDADTTSEFEHIIDRIRQAGLPELERIAGRSTIAKCQNCIYRSLCSFSHA